MKEEIWKDIYFIENGVEYDYRGLYQVSNKGNIKSLNYHRTGKEKMLTLDNNKGYFRVKLHNKDKTKRFLVHRLVAHMFIDGYFDGADIDHINTIKNDNRAENLRWCTKIENNNNLLTKKHISESNKGENAYWYGKQQPKDFVEKRIGAIKKTLVERWSIDGTLIDMHYRHEYMEMGFNGGHISSCCKGKRKSHAGYIWKYHEE